jgi:hypothetical protein
MCDYSLHNVASRPAAIGDKLVTTRFMNACTRGFASVDQPEVAVCLRPGTEIAFEREVAVESGFGFLPSRRLRGKVARFREVNAGHPMLHHDALEFPDGEVVLLTRLAEGQRAVVLQMPAGGRAAPRTWRLRETVIG